MKVHISARVDEDLARFLDSYQVQQGIRSRSEALEKAIEALRELALEAAYTQATEEWLSQNDEVLEAWDRLAGDGLAEDEDW